MRRVAITTLEVYRKYLNEVNDFATEQSVIDAIKGVYTGRVEYPAIGSAFHKIVEIGTNGFDGRVDGKFSIDIDGNQVLMSKAQVLTALNYRMSFPKALFEQKIGRDFHCKDMDIYVGGRVDMLHGNFIRDIKTKYSPIQLKDYQDSCQWRFYLDLTDLDTFYFDMFEFKGYKVDTHGFDVSELELVPAYSIECIRYEKMKADNQKLVEDFCDFCITHDLVQFLKPKEE